MSAHLLPLFVSQLRGPGNELSEGYLLAAGLRPTGFLTFGDAQHLLFEPSAHDIPLLLLLHHYCNYSYSHYIARVHAFKLIASGLFHCPVRDFTILEQ